MLRGDLVEPVRLRAEEQDPCGRGEAPRDQPEDDPELVVADLAVDRHRDPEAEHDERHQGEEPSGDGLCPVADLKQLVVVVRELREQRDDRDEEAAADPDDCGADVQHLEDEVPGSVRGEDDRDDD